MTWWLLFFGISLFAEDHSVEKYCFESLSRMERASSKLQFVLTPSDRVEKDEQCLLISMRPHRRELLQKYVRSIDPEVIISFSSEDRPKDPCKLKIEKIKHVDNQSHSIGVSTDHGPHTQAAHSSGSGSETFSIQTLGKFEFSANQDSVKGDCKFLGPDRYEISLTISKDPAPPPTPSIHNGMIIVTPPPDQETMSASTQLQLQRGSRVEIGGIVKQLKIGSNNASQQDGAKLNADDKKSSEKIYLSID